MMPLRFIRCLASQKAALTRSWFTCTNIKSLSPICTASYQSPLSNGYKSRTLSTGVSNFSAVSSSAQTKPAPQISLQEKEFIVEVNGSKRLLNYLWLRDHCRCDQCYNHGTFQKNVAPHVHPPDIKPVDATVLDDDSITMTWPDGHESTYSTDWLLHHAYPASTKKAQKFLWDAELISKETVEMVPYESFKEEKGLNMLLHNLLKYGFGVVDGCEASVEATQKVAERLCIIQNTLYGVMYDFTSNIMAFADTAYTNLALGAHTDTTYFSLPCGIQVFHCLEHDGEGGQTLLVDGFHAAESFRKSDPGGFDLLCSLRIHHEYIDKKTGVEVRSLDPVLKVHPVSKELEWIRYNHYDRSPISTIPSNQMANFYKALGSLSGFVEDPGSKHWLKMKPGMVLFVDNWRVMHGRSAFTGRRRICGCYLPRDDWISRATTQGLL